jgi:hypothetical protein
MGLGLINDRAWAVLVGAATKSAPVTTTMDRTFFRFISFPSLRMPTGGRRTPQPTTSVKVAVVDVPARFRKSKSVGAVFGLTSSKYQSGEVDWSGKISRCGDEMMRTMLYEAAQSMLHSKKWSWLKAWAMQIARRRGMKKAVVALARRLAVIMHRMWIDGTEFRWTREQAAAAA